MYPMPARMINILHLFFSLQFRRTRQMFKGGGITLFYDCNQRDKGRFVRDIVLQ